MTFPVTHCCQITQAYNTNSLLLEAENSLVLHSTHLNEYATHQKHLHSQKNCLQNMTFKKLVTKLLS